VAPAEGGGGGGGVGVECSVWFKRVSKPTPVDYKGILRTLDNVIFAAHTRSLFDGMVISRKVRNKFLRREKSLTFLPFFVIQPRVAQKLV
jgi:hypothetical protein